MPFTPSIAFSPYAHEVLLAAFAVNMPLVPLVPLTTLVSLTPLVVLLALASLPALVSLVPLVPFIRLSALVPFAHKVLFCSLLV